MLHMFLTAVIKANYLVSAATGDRVTGGRNKDMTGYVSTA